MHFLPLPHHDEPHPDVDHVVPALDGDDEHHVLPGPRPLAGVGVVEDAVGDLDVEPELPERPVEQPVLLVAQPAAPPHHQLVEDEVANERE